VAIRYLRQLNEDLDRAVLVVAKTIEGPASIPHAALRSRSPPRRALRDARLLFVALRGGHAKDPSGIRTTNAEFVAETLYAVAAEPA
jgi:hypothetical protein